MSDERPTDEQLMRYFDGELPEAEAAQVAARIDADPDYRARYAALSSLNAAFGASAAHVSAEVDFDALFARIESGIAAEPRANAAQAQAPGLLSRIGSWLGTLMEQPAQLWVPAAGLTAAVAVTLAVTQSHPSSDDHAAPGGQVSALPKPPPAEDNSDRPPPRAPVAVAAVGAVASSEVVQVDFGDNTGTVFEIALAEGVSTPVVWINDEE